MKHLVTLLVVLGLAAGANAALFTEDFSGDLSAWSSVDASQVIVGGALQDYDGATNSVMTATFAAVTSGSVILDFDLTASAAWGNLAMALTDSTGNGAVLDLYIGDTYLGFGTGLTTDFGDTKSNSSYIDNDLVITDVNAMRYVLNIDTGLVLGWENGTRYVVGSVDLSGVSGGISAVSIKTHKKLTALDNIVVDIPEPASLALLGMGGLGMLIRRKR